MIVGVLPSGLNATVDWLASSRAVQWVAPRPVVRTRGRPMNAYEGYAMTTRSLMNAEASEVVQGAGLGLSPFHEAGITGVGQVVGCGDTGVDVRHCAFQQANKFAMHRGADMLDTDGHGTHVAGSIAGALTDSETHGPYDGVAKDARLAFTDIGSLVHECCDTGWDGECGYDYCCGTVTKCTASSPDVWSYTGLYPADTMGDDYYEYARVAGARIHSDSWGWSAKQYSQSVYEIDEFVARNPSFLPMFALGNDGKYTQSVYEYHGGAQHVYETCPWCTKQEIMDGLCPWCTKVDYTDGRYSFGAPANAKNILGVGATLSSNSGPISSTSEDTNVYEVDIGGPMGKHWEHFKIRGYGGLADLTSPPGGSHAIDQVDVAVADPLDACDALTSDMSGKLALIQRGTCAFATKVQNAVDAGAVAVMIFNHHYLSGPIPFMSGSVRRNHVDDPRA